MRGAPPASNRRIHLIRSIHVQQESGLLSTPDSVLRIQPLLEQLFEDLNSYSETSIPVDAFNSIELQIFPFYPNPPKVNNWQVPVALINLEKRKDPNWDMSMAKACFQTVILSCC